MSDWSPILGLPLWVWLFVMPAAFAVLARMQRNRMRPALERVWRLLDRVYLASGVLAAIFMMTILILIVFQMAARWVASPLKGQPSSPAMRWRRQAFSRWRTPLAGARISVSILLNLNSFTRMWLDAAAMLVAAVIATYFARYAVKTNFLSEMLNDRTQDQIPEWFVTFLSMFATTGLGAGVAGQR